MLAMDNKIKDSEACTKRQKRQQSEKVIEVGFVAGVGIAATYNSILGNAKRECNGEFEILESKL